MDMNRLGQRLKGDPLSWLLEPDPANPGVRYFALRDLLDRPEDDADVQTARAVVMTSGPVPAILNAQYPEGYWVKPGSGYSPKYRGTVWQIIFLAELGADPADERVRQGCEYLLSHSIAANGAFSCLQAPVPSGAIPCLNGNLLRALLRLGYENDPRVQTALDWLARSITGEGQFRYLKSGTSGPNCACSANGGQPCAWGAVKAIRALIAVPPGQRTPAVQHAIEAGAEFLLSRDPAVADYPHTERVSSTWFKFGFPLSYWSDVLEIVEVLAGLGYGRDPRLAPAIEFILSKQDTAGRWKLENALNGKMWADIERKGRPSKWVTLRARRALKATDAHDD
ncbi:MAG: nitrogen fixation protein NifH [Chloroflexi bacterium]|nr:nitrogen fixation protein NifH [Chloroflexota bacterium]MBU1748643.1 nitrogen fixation protein NifH [Chloroflexota bacterium]